MRILLHLPTAVLMAVPCLASTGDAARAVDPDRRPRLRVLVVEDVELNRAALGEMLGQHGYEVAFAENGEQAVALVARERFDVVLMDVQMPVMDGIEATRRIRQLGPPAGAVSIVGFTTNVREQDRRRYRAAGMNHCLSKAATWPELVAALDVAARPEANAAPDR
jgi:CheY-like chemotaxis protein